MRSGMCSCVCQSSNSCCHSAATFHHIAMAAWPNSGMVRAYLAAARRHVGSAGETSLTWIDLRSPAMPCALFTCDILRSSPLASATDSTMILRRALTSLTEQPFALARTGWRRKRNRSALGGLHRS